MLLDLARQDADNAGIPGARRDRRSHGAAGAALHGEQYNWHYDNELPRRSVTGRYEGNLK
jgi:hypothetical protein